MLCYKRARECKYRLSSILNKLCQIYSLPRHLLFLSVGVLLAVSLPSTAQSDLPTSRKLLHAVFEGDTVGAWPIIQGKKNALDSTILFNQLEQSKLKLWNQGFLEASYEVSYRSSDSVDILLITGPKYQWSAIESGNVPESVLVKAGFIQKKQLKRNRFSTQSQLVSLQATISRYMADSGYPFASVLLDTLSFEHYTLHGRLRLLYGPRIEYDTLTLRGRAKMSRTFLGAFLQVSPGKPYKESDVRNMQRRLAQLPYVRLVGPPSILYANGKARPELTLDPRQSSQIDGIVGLLPNEEENNRLLITGEFNLKLQNLFGTGKFLGVQWLRQKALSQQLDLQYQNPRLFKTPLDIALRFNLLKEDTTFLNLDRRISLAYPLGVGGSISLVTRIQSSRVLSTAQYANSTFLPAVNNSLVVSYGLGYQLSMLDDVFYPHKGWSIELTALAGQRTITPIESVNPALYASIPLKSSQWNLQADIISYLPIRKRMVWLCRAHGAALEAPSLFQGDLYRVGGLQSMRGFNQNYFFASRYVVGTSEVRLFLEQTTYVLAFVDQGYMYFNLPGRFFEDSPLALGVGFSFASGPGVFNFVYAVGRDRTQRMQASLSKIHFGFVSRF